MLSNLQMNDVHWEMRDFFLPSTWFLQFLFFLVVIFGAEVYASVELFRFYDEVRNQINYTDL